MWTTCKEPTAEYKGMSRQSIAHVSAPFSSKISPILQYPLIAEMQNFEGVRRELGCHHAALNSPGSDLDIPNTRTCHELLAPTLRQWTF